MHSLMASPPPSLPKSKKHEVFPSQEASPSVSPTSFPLPQPTQQIQSVYSRCFKRQPMGTSEEGRPFTRAELAARQAVHHFFATTYSQQQHTLLELDQEFRKIPTPPMNIQVKAFPWKLEDLSKTTIPIQFCKLIKFYWMLHSFVAQSMH